MKKEIDQMLVKAGAYFGGEGVVYADFDPKKFAALVRADERSSWPAEMEAMERQVNILTDALAEAKADEQGASHEP